MRIPAQLQTLDDALLAWQRYQQIPYEKFAGSLVKYMSSIKRRKYNA
jgi:hypothetical protein